MISFSFNDGGRIAAGFKGTAGDCVTRAIAIASQQPYEAVRTALMDEMKAWRHKSRSKAASRRKSNSVRNGTPRQVYEPYLIRLGWTWTPTMKIGSGATVHLKASELPPGRLICRVTRHVVAVIDGTIHDLTDCSRDGSRTLYGYYSRSVN